MARTITSLQRPRASQSIESSPGRQQSKSTPARRRETHRDLVEQIVIAFLLAFLVRGFEAEAFVIPTGSMAPTLMGAHKDVVCPHCGFNFTVNAANELSEPGNPLSSVLSGLCGNCHAPINLDDQPIFNGDRILVMKHLYNLPWISDSEPKRWDVVVFHYPAGPETNYIKRLVGMPGEDLRMYYGDILTRSSPAEEFRIERKPLRHQEAMQMNVWDDRFRPRLLVGHPEWQRWRGTEPSAWSEEAPGRFATAAGPDWNELRYRHLVPDTAQWAALLAGRTLPHPPREQLVTDFYAYNAGWHRRAYPESRFLPQHWWAI